MKSYIGTLDFSENCKTAITIGKFDGVHIGHRKLLNKIMDKKKTGLKPCVFTFDNPPSSVLSGKELKVITSNSEKREIMEQLGIELFIACPFEPSVLMMEAEDFVERILVDKLNVQYIAVGPDCRFGHDRKGDYELLKQLQNKFGYTVEIIDKECYEGVEISSTLIRNEIEAGHMEAVTYMLGRPYSFEGEVAFGNQIGRRMNFPTTNIIPKKNKILPPNGVYVSCVKYDNKIYKGITNIGKKPTVTTDDLIGIETYLFDFAKQIYGEQIKVWLLNYERPEQKFANIEELQERINKDLQYGINYFSVNGSAFASDSFI